MDTCTHCRAPIPSWTRAGSPESDNNNHPQAIPGGGFVAVLLGDPWAGLLQPVAYSETRADGTQGGLWCTKRACAQAMRKQLGLPLSGRGCPLTKKR